MGSTDWPEVAGGCLETGVGAKQSSQEDRVFPDIDLESVGRPAPDSLDEVWRDPCFCESGGATRAEGVACDIAGEVAVKARDEP
jgi:hypothetical protein